MAHTRETTLDTLLEFVRDTRGFDFTGYKRSSIQRRVGKRMSELGIEHYEEYLDYLQLHGDEFVELFNMILINVTGFSAIRRRGSTSRPRSFPSCSPRDRPRRLSGCGRPAARRAKSPTRLPWCSPG